MMHAAYMGITMFKFLCHNGEMARSISEIDWSSTSLGSSENWPSSLKAHLSLILNSSVPMYIVWGQDKISFQNDSHYNENGKLNSKIYSAFIDEVLKTGKLIGHCSPLFDDNFKVAGVLVSSAQSDLANERENFRNLFRQTPEMVCILKGPEHTFEFVNEAHIKALGFDATGMAVRVAQPESVEVHGILDDVYKSGVTAHLREIPVTLGTKLRYFNLTYAARKNEFGYPNGVMILGAEVTDQVEAREGIILARNEAEISLKKRDEFLSIASHELRTPLTSLKMQLQLGYKAHNKTPIKNQLDERINNSLLKSIKQVNKLADLVDDLLDVSKIESGKLTFNFQQTDITALLSEVIDRFAEQAADIKVPIGFNPSPTRQIHCDPYRLEQVFANLISNAFKYGGGKMVNLKVWEEKNDIFVEVQDSGIGISGEKIPLIFKRYERAIPDSRISGLGLGLYITKTIVEAHKGEINVHSELGIGSKFTVRIPLNAH